MKIRILFFVIAVFLISLSTETHAGSGNENAAPSVSMRVISSDSTLGMGNCTNGQYLIGQSFDRANPKFPYKILVRITYVSIDGEMTYSSLTKEGSTLEELYDRIDYNTGFANFAIDLGSCQSKPQTVSITSIFKMPNEGVELFTNSTPIAAIPKAPLDSEEE